ncbi:MAG: hypothetical protein HRU19_06115 [Pseudobacteriovorax sp.]|nr:hypothetical protein [Pseudobacteriovorax sp.]
MLRQSLLLVKIFVSSFIRKIRYDFISESVVLVCSSVLLFLFYYMFQDFIHVKMAALDASTRENFAKTFSYILLFVTAYAVTKWTRGESKLEFSTIGQTATRLGTDKVTVAWYRLIQSTLIQICCFVSQWVIINSFFYPFSIGQILGLQTLISAFLFLSLKWSSPQIKKHTAYRGSQKHKQHSPSQALVAWRWQQILFRQRSSRIALTAGGGSAALLVISLFLNKADSLIILLSMAMGFFVGSAIIFQIEEDMKHCWLEKTLGISHERYTSAYLKVGILASLTMSIFLCLTIFTLYFVLGKSFDLVTSLKVIPISSIGPLAVAPLMFQIDPEKSLVQMLLCFFVCLFLGTGIFAHWLFAAAIPILLYYGMKYQKDLFYK